MCIVHALFSRWCVFPRKQTNKKPGFFQLALHNDSLGINVLRLYSKEWKVCTRSRIKILAMNN